MPVELSSWIGRTLASDRYRVTGKLGEGGMGFVFQAVDRHLERDVVIKVPRRDVLEDPAFAGRFQREIRSLVRLAHPHIVKVLDVGEADGLPFAVLQYLSGGSLANRINPGVPVTVRVKKLQDWLAQIAAALDFTHSQGYIHRDVKPDNILFDAPGNVFLSDFGIAKVLADSRSAGTQTLRTQTGVVLGTPQYMAPELIMGQPHDGRVDQYALAIVVYEMLSGVLPITGPTPAAILVEQTLKQPVALDELVPDFPHGVAVAVHKALAKNAADRYPDCATFARAVLAAAAVATGADARPPGTRQVSSPFGVSQPPVALPVERAPETARIARTYADWHASPNPATPVPRAPWTAKNKRDTEDSGERRRSRASRAQKRKKVAYLIIACSLGILLLGSGISVVIILANSASRTAATTAPVQEPVREPVATATPAPAIAQPEPLADAQPDPAPIDKRTKTGVLEVGDYRVRVVHLRPEGQRLLVELQIENEGAKASSSLAPWNKDSNVPRLSDRRGNDFAWIASAGQDSSHLVLEPRKPRGLAIYFELPPADVEALNLELPAAVFGRAGRLGFELRDDMLLFVTARFRKSKAVPGLREALASAEPGRRAAAARALGETGPAAAAAVRELMDRLNEDTPLVRAAAAQALGQIGPAAREARPALVRALSDADAQVGALAAKALKLLPAPSAEDIGDLRQALREQNVKMRAYALDALKGVGPAAQRALPEILQALKDKDPGLRTAAAGVLATIADDEAITALAEARKDQEVSVRRSVVRSLDALRPAPGTIPALIAALDDPDEETARLASAALKTARFAKEDIAALGNMLSQGEANGRASAAAFLAALGPDARAAKASLIKALNDQDKQVRKHAATALGNLKADAWEVSTKLAALLTDEDRAVRKSAIAALGQLGPDAGAAAPQLFQALHDDQLHEEISRALVKIGKKAVPTLVEKLSVKQDSVKIEACRLLGEIGPDAADAIEALSALAQDKKNQLPRVWKAAGQALKKIER